MSAFSRIFIDKIIQKLCSIICVLLVLTISIFLTSKMSIAQGQLGQPTGEVILKVVGNIEKTNIDGEAHFDMDMLRTLPSSVITTETPWTDGPVEFEGVNLKYFLDYLGANGEDIDAIAADGYHVLIPLQDATDYPIVMTYRVYGEDLISGRRGPLWIMYPFDEYPDTQSDTYEERAIWQLIKLRIQ